MNKISAILYFFVVSLPFGLSQNRIYVKYDAQGTGSGDSWQNAYISLQAALASAAAGDSLWVAEGTYFPTENQDRDASFQPESGVKIFGGFSGSESDFSQRDWILHPTVLSGDIGIPADSTDNSFTVMYLDNPDSTTVVDGMIFRYGNADYPLGDVPASSEKRNGGALYIMGENGEAYPLISNCRFEHNTAVRNGGAVYVNGAGTGSVAPEFRNCDFEYNKAGQSGGGLYRDGCSWVDRPDFFRCRFIKNGAGTFGGGLFALDAERTDLVDVSDCYFEHNHAGSYGGGAAIRTGRQSGGRLAVRNCKFTKNKNCALTVLNKGFLYISYLNIDRTVFDDNSESDFDVMDIWLDCISNPDGPNHGNISNCVFKNIDNDINNLVHGKVISGGFGGVDTFIFNFERDTFFNNKVNGIINIPSSAKISNNVLYDNNSEYGIFSSGLDFCIYNSIFNNNDLNSLFPLASDDKLLAENLTIVNNDLSFIVLNKDFNEVVFNNTLFLNISIVGFSDTLNSGFYNNFLLNNSLLDATLCLPISNYYAVNCNNTLTGIDPLFVNPDSSDYRLQPCSPLVNAGSNAWVSSPTDLAGAPRIQGGTVDIGAYETAAPALAAPAEALPACPGGANGAIEAAYEGGCGPFTFAWTDAFSNTGSNLTQLPAGTYTVTVTDQRGSSPSISFGTTAAPTPCAPGCRRGNTTLLSPTRWAAPLRATSP